MIRKINPNLVNLSSREGLKIMFMFYDRIAKFWDYKLKVETFLYIWIYNCLKEIPIYYDDCYIKLKKDYDKNWNLLKFKSFENGFIGLDFSDKKDKTTFYIYDKKEKRIINECDYDVFKQIISQTIQSFHFESLITKL